MELTPQERKQLLNAYYGLTVKLNSYYGLTVKPHAVAPDLKDYKDMHIESRDISLCMYDYAKEILKHERFN